MKFKVMRNRIIYILFLVICGLLQVSCSPRLVKPASGPCYWDLEPLIHSRNKYDIQGTILDKSTIKDSIKIGKPLEIICKERNYIRYSRQGTALIYQHGNIDFVNTYRLYVKGKPIKGQCIKVKIDDKYIFINLRTKEIIYSYPTDFKFNEKYIMLFYELHKGTYYLRISKKADNSMYNLGPYLVTVSPRNVKREVVVEFEK